VYGTVLTLCRNPRWARELAASLLDFAVIDLEHASYARSEVADLADTLAAHGLAPLVRVATARPELVAQALDAGAHGVLVPYCEHRREVEEVVAAARLRPLKGELLARARKGKFAARAVEEYLARYNRHALVVIGIESVPAVRRLPELCGVEGVDAVFVGAHDLALSMGLPDRFEDPRVGRAFTDVITRCARLGVPAGVWPTDHAGASRYLRAGMRFVLYRTDVDVLTSGLRQGLKALRDLGDLAPTVPTARGPAPPAPVRSRPSTRRARPRSAGR
jgi:4-hydroxy-2-oxoheptanedioate aldolase